MAQSLVCLKRKRNSMHNIIKINDPALNKSYIQELLQDQMANMPNILDLTQTGPKKLRYTQQELSDRATNNVPDFSYAFIEMINNATIQEPEFSSDTPLVGHLIVKFRQVWNWMSTRWYILPIIGQQSDVNMQMALMLMDMAQLQTLNTRHITKLEAKINGLEEYILQQKGQ